MCVVLPEELQAALDALPRLREKVREALVLFAVEPLSVEDRTAGSILLHGLDEQIDHSIAKAHHAVALWSQNEIDAQQVAEAVLAPERLASEVVGAFWEVLHGAPVLPR